MAETVSFSSPADEKLALELVAKRTQALKARIAELEQALRIGLSIMEDIHYGDADCTCTGPDPDCIRARHWRDAARKVLEPSKERGRG